MTSVKDLMTKEVLTIALNSTVYDAAKLMRAHKRGSIVVVDKDEPIGIITERDLARKIVAENLLSSDVKIENIMSQPIITIEPEASIKEVARMMLKNEVRRLPVIKDKKLVGIIVATDFIRHLGKKSISDEILDAVSRHPYYPYYPVP